MNVRRGGEEYMSVRVLCLLRINCRNTQCNAPAQLHHGARQNGTPVCSAELRVDDMRYRQSEN